MWIEILKRQVEQRGPRQVAKELGVSRSTVDLVCQGKYQASTTKVEGRVQKIYGTGGNIECPVKGLITPIECAENFRKAKVIGMKAGNPLTLKLYKECLRCAIRKKS